MKIDTIERAWDDMSPKEKILIMASIILILGGLFFLVGYQVGVNMMYDWHVGACDAMIEDTCGMFLKAKW